MNTFPFLPILTLIFVTLKLMNYINWSWAYVLFPMWGGALIVISVFVIGVIIAFFKEFRK